MVHRISAIPIATINMNATLESTAKTDLDDVPLHCLGRNTCRQLTVLNKKKILRTENGYERDYRGIASLAEVNSPLDCDDPINKVLKQWMQEHPATANVKNLISFLGEIGRWDVADDIYENLVSDAKNFKERKRQQPRPVVQEKVEITHSPFENEVLTTDDALCVQKGLPLQRYDAFVLFADEDVQYAAEIKKNLEDTLNFKLCTINDLLLGIPFTYQALSKLIEERCYRLLVIFTQNFLNSRQNEFLLNYTQVEQIETNTRKIIPLIYDNNVRIPRTLKIYTHLKYFGNTTPLSNFWRRLESSIRDVPTNYTKEIESLPTPPTNIPCIIINDNNNYDEGRPPNEQLHELRNARSTTQLNLDVRNQKDKNYSMPDLTKTKEAASKEKKRRNILGWFSRKRSQRAKET